MRQTHKIEIFMIPVYSSFTFYWLKDMPVDSLWRDFDYFFYYLYSMKILVITTPVVLWFALTGAAPVPVKISRTILVVCSFMFIYIGTFIEHAWRFPYGPTTVCEVFPERNECR
jgi:hypothetical protein